jgi:hypothetical protein
LPSVFLSDATISGVRLMIQTGLPRHSTVFISPGLSAEMSTSTGAPAAFARSDGWKVLTSAPAAARPTTPPAAPVATSKPRRPESTCFSLLIQTPISQSANKIWKPRTNLK